MTDADIASAMCPGAPLDEGVARAVKVLRDAGVETYESCEGGGGRVMPTPSPPCDSTGGQGDGWWALTACASYGFPVAELGRVWTLIDGEPTGPDWQIIFRKKID